MKNRTIIRLFSLLILYGLTVTPINKKKPLKSPIKWVYSNQQEEMYDWETFIKAIVWVESRGKHDAVGKCDDVGVLQLRRIMVDEANRIIGSNHFTYQDRLDSVKSIEMFNIVQAHRNPNYCLKKAAKIWNPTAGDWYYNKIMDKYNELLACE